MAVPTIEQIRETSDRTTERLIELQRRREAREAENNDPIPDAPPAPLPLSTVSLWAMAGIFAAGLGVGAALVAIAVTVIF